MKPSIDPNKIVVLTGAGISAESGLATFRDSNGLWENYSWEEVASIGGWRRNPGLVLDFFNARRKQAWAAKPNAAHTALARLEEKYEVVVITQNVDELHEKGGSSKVIHVHGSLSYARSSINPELRYRIDDQPIELGQLCEDGSQMRPDIVWFGEEVPRMDECWEHFATAGKVLIIGTSLAVFPVASLASAASANAEKVLVAFDVEGVPFGFTFHQGKATEHVPMVVERWLGEAGQGGL